MNHREYLVINHKWYKVNQFVKANLNECNIYIQYFLVILDEIGRNVGWKVYPLEKAIQDSNPTLVY